MTEALRRASQMRGKGDGVPGAGALRGERGRYRLPTIDVQLVAQKSPPTGSRNPPVLAWAAHDARLNRREGIVIAPNARLLDARHITLDGVAPLREGVRARIVDENGGFSRVVIGRAEGYLPSSNVLPIAKR